ncbi:hypothetical protein [Bartonella tamiae]|uniref:Uncharacterized protein n=1 Tax=Bartonella tamiae Th239 TaxID=1094558 RepID=J1JX79_9HYPH|nr:hypothetical protein [Bartonella tamiae]EJF89215.1 hypothetical protein ME5_01766 [Bartonella tamiae Th239]EJF95381.1 hypothetical protein MEG_00114 [Bartonella tamiae Th307]
MTIYSNIASGAQIINRETDILTIKNYNATGANVSYESSGVMHISNNT